MSRTNLQGLGTVLRLEYPKSGSFQHYRADVENAFLIVHNQNGLLLTCLACERYRDEGVAVKKTQAGRSQFRLPDAARSEKRAKEIVDNLGGSEVRLQGGIRASDTMGRGNDPNPPGS